MAHYCLLNKVKILHALKDHIWLRPWLSLSLNQYSTNLDFFFQSLDILGFKTMPWFSAMPCPKPGPSHMLLHLLVMLFLFALLIPTQVSDCHLMTRSPWRPVLYLMLKEFAPKYSNRYCSVTTWIIFELNNYLTGIIL